jgi:2'-5' RNA ligase
VRAALADEVAGLRGVGRSVAWVAPGNLHLTLKFLGRVEREQLTLVAAALADVAAGARPFEVAIRGLGAFPTATRPRVVWAGIDTGAGDAAALAERIDAALAPVGFAAEARPFAAHVTLGRAREPRRDPALTAAVAAAAGRGFGSFRVESVALMRSDLSPRGARYTALASWMLGRQAANPVSSLQGETDG